MATVPAWRREELEQLKELEELDELRKLQKLQKVQRLHEAGVGEAGGGMSCMTEEARAVEAGGASG